MIFYAITKEKKAVGIPQLLHYKACVKKYREKNFNPLCVGIIAFGGFRPTRCWSLRHCHRTWRF